MSDRPPRLDPDARAGLEEQRAFLLRSLADLEREHDAGDLSDDDYQTLRDDYTARTAEVLRALERHTEAFAAVPRPRNRVRTAAIAVGVVAFAGLAGVMVAGALGARQAGDSASGGITVEKTTSQRANECSAKITTAPTEAFTCFEDILKEDPKNPVALTWSAWQLSLTSDQVEGADRTRLQALAAVRLDSAVESDPSYSYARAFRAVVAYRNGRFADAKRYLAEFEANDPSSDAAQIIKQMDLAAKIDDALATQGPGPTASSTTTTTEAGGG